MSWQHRSVTMPATCSSDDHLMNVLERLQSCGCTASEWYGLTCGTVVRTTVQDRIVDDQYTVEKAPHHPVYVTSQEVIEILNVLVNDGSSVGAYTLNLIAPPKLTSEILQLTTLS